MQRSYSPVSHPGWLPARAPILSVRDARDVTVWRQRHTPLFLSGTTRNRLELAPRISSIVGIVIVHFKTRRQSANPASRWVPVALHEEQYPKFVGVLHGCWRWGVNGWRQPTEARRFRESSCGDESLHLGQESSKTVISVKSKITILMAENLNSKRKECKRAR